MSATVRASDPSRRVRLHAAVTHPLASIWIRLPNTRRRELLPWFETVLPNVLSAVKRGETLIEVI